MANIDYYTAISDTALRSRVEGTVLKAAPSVLIESTATTHHSARYALAQRILQGGVNYGEWVRWVVTDPTVAAKINVLPTVTDAELDSVVAAAWDKVAGFSPGAP